MNAIRYIIKSGLMIMVICMLTLTASCHQEPDVVDSQGNKIYLNQLKGKYLVINYWATWCKPCLKEMPALNDLYKNNTKKLMVIGVSYDKLTSDEMNAVKKNRHIQYPLAAHFPMAKYGITSASVLPITFIINPQGKLIKTLKGPQTEAQFSAAIPAA